MYLPNLILGTSINSPLGLFVFIGFAALIGGIFYWSHVQTKKRTEALRQIAASLDLKFDSEKYKPEALGLGRIESFTKGHSRKVFNLMRGTFADAECLVFDYRYTTGGGKNSSTYEQTVVAFQIKGAQLPQFTCKPEHFFHKFADMFVFEDINFEQHPRFSDSYRLNGKDEAAVRSIFNDSVIQLLEQERGHPWSVDGGGDWLAIHKANRKVEPQACGQFLLDCTTLLNEMTLP